MRRTLVPIALALAALGCHDAPDVPPLPATPVDGRPSVTLTRVVALDDSTIEVEGDAADPDGLQAVEWWTHSIRGVERHAPIPIRVGTTAVHFRIALPPHQHGTYDNPWEGDYFVEVRAYDRFWNGAQYPDPTTAARPVYAGVTAPLLAVDASTADTLRQLELRPVVRTRALDPLARIDVVVDSGTPAERRLSYDQHGIIRTTTTRSRFLEDTIEVEIPGIATEGRHVVSLTAVDTAGRRSAPVRYTPTVVVPERRYAMRPLGALGGADSWASDLTDAGTVAGWAEDARGRRPAATWRASTDRWTALPAPDSVDSEASALNARGDVVGSVGGVARLWRADGSVVSLQTGSCCARLVDVNEAGVSVGTSARPGGQVFVYDGARTLTLCANAGRPTAIDDRGGVVGAAVFDAVEGPLACNGDVTIAWPERRPWAPTGGGPIALADGLGDYVSRRSGEWTLSVPRAGGAIGFPAAEGLYLTPWIGPATPVAMSRARLLVALDPASGALWLVDVARRATARIRVPDGWAIDAVTAIDAAGTIAAHAELRTTGTRGAVLLTPVP